MFSRTELHVSKCGHFEILKANNYFTLFVDGVNVAKYRTLTQAKRAAC